MNIAAILLYVSHFVDFGFYNSLTFFIQDAAIVSAPLPVVRSLLPLSADVQYNANGPQVSLVTINRF